MKLCVGLSPCVIWIRCEEGALPDKANRIVREWWEGIKNCLHVIRENLNSRYIPVINSNIGKRSEEYCNWISIHQANRISEEKGTNGQRDTCILKNSGHDIYFVQPKCKLSPTTTVICNLLCLLIASPGLEKARRFSILFLLSNGRHWIENKSTIKISNPVICMSLMTGRIQLLHTIAPIEKIAQYFIRRQAIFSEIWSKIETLNYTLQLQS